MAQDLLQLGCAVPTDDDATGHFFIKPKRGSDKLRAIFNGKWINAQWPWNPLHYTLPNFEALKPLLRSHHKLFFHRTDIKNFYWSFLLPPSLSSRFVFSLRSPTGSMQSYALTRPPFGWDYIPTLANTTIHAILTPSKDVLHFIYVDDILTVSLSEALCHSSASDARTALTSAGFKIHQPGSDKCSAVPEATSHFVGKTIISGSSPSIQNNSNTSLSMLFFVLIGASASLSPRALSCIAGTLQWGSMHNKFARPFFYGIHRLASLPSTARITLKRGTKAALLKAVMLADIPWTPNDMQLARPPISTTLAFVDAAISVRAASAVLQSPNGAIYTRWKLPTFCTTQQDAELYALIRTYRWLDSFLQSFCIVSDSSSSISSVLSLNTGAHASTRAQLLRSLATVLATASAPHFLAWIPSIHNPADGPSRYLPFTNSPLLIPTSLLLPPLDLSFCSFSIPE